MDRTSSVGIPNITTPTYAEFWSSRISPGVGLLRCTTISVVLETEQHQLQHHYPPTTALLLAYEEENAVAVAGHLLTP